jgi:hypothetical protein
VVRYLGDRIEYAPQKPAAAALVQPENGHQNT